MPSNLAPERLSVFNDRRFRLLYVANLTSTLGSTFSPIALSFAAIDLTGSAADLGYVLAAAMIPRSLLLLVGGTVADRYSRTAIMVVSSLASAGAQLLAVAAMLAGMARIGDLLALAAITSAAGAFFAPAAQGIIPQVVSTGQVRQANVHIRITNSASLVLGPALAGGLIAATSPAWAILADAVSFLAAAPMLLALRLPARGHSRAAGMLRQLRNGWQAFWSRTWLWAVVLQCAFMNMGYSTGMRLIGPLTAQRHYGGVAAWGLVLSANGVGYILGGFLCFWFKPRRLLLTGVCCASGLALPLIAIAFTAPLWLLIAAALLCGILLEQLGVAWATSMQQHLPDDLLSRASAYDLFGSDLLIPVGYLLGGPTVATLGIGGSLSVCIALILIPTLLVLSSRQVRQLEQPGPALNEQAACAA